MTQLANMTKSNQVKLSFKSLINIINYIHLFYTYVDITLAYIHTHNVSY